MIISLRFHAEKRRVNRAFFLRGFETKTPARPAVESFTVGSSSEDEEEDEAAAFFFLRVVAAFRAAEGLGRLAGGISEWSCFAGADHW